MYTPSLPRLTEEAQFGLVQIGEEFYLPNLPERYMKVHAAVGRIVRNGKVYDFPFHPAQHVWKVVEQ